MLAQPEQLCRLSFGCSELRIGRASPHSADDPLWHGNTDGPCALIVPQAESQRTELMLRAKACVC